MSQAALVSAFRRVLELSQLTPQETAVILTDGSTPPAYVEVAHQAFAHLGVPVFHLDVSASVPSGKSIPTPGAIGDLFSAVPGAMAALKESDFVLDFLSSELGGLIHDKARAEVAGAGTRMLHVSDPPEVLLRLQPTVELRDRCLLAVERMCAANELHATSDAGTDLRVDLAGAQVNSLYGYVERPGQAGAWPGGFVAAYPVSGTARGRVVLSPGDVNLTAMRYFESPVTLEFEADHVTHIAGTGLDADLLRDYYSVWDEPEAYGLSHVGWGLNTRAQWWAMTLQHPIVGEFTEARTFAGNFMISTGVNPAIGRRTRCHFDLPMRGCTVALDGEVVVNAGVLVDEDALIGS